MPTKHLTERAAQSLKAALKQVDYWDSSFKVRGVSFGVRVFPSGSKAYICRYRSRRGGRPQIVLGDPKHMGFAEARAKAIEIKKKIDRGEDPAHERAELKAAETVSELCEQYLRQHAEVNKKDHGAYDRLVINKYVAPAWGSMKAREVRRADVMALLDRITVEHEAPIMANRVRALLSKLFSFALEREIVDASPCAGLGRKNKESAKARVLTDVEIKALWDRLESYKEPVAALLRVILLSAQRPGEVMAMQWSEIEGDVWTLPPERTKNGREHKVPLSPPIQAQLKTLLKLNQTAKSESWIPDKTAFDIYVFPTARAGYVRPRSIQNAIKELNEFLKKDLTTCAPFTAHDLRRTAATGMRKLKVSREAVAKILNHKSAEGPVTGIYDRYDEWPEMRRALSVWGAHVGRLAEGTLPEKVVSIRGRK